MPKRRPTELNDAFLWNCLIDDVVPDPKAFIKRGELTQGSRGFAVAEKDVSGFKIPRAKFSANRQCSWNNEVLPCMVKASVPARPLTKYELEPYKANYVVADLITKQARRAAAQEKLSVFVVDSHHLVNLEITEFGKQDHRRRAELLPGKFSDSKRASRTNETAAPQTPLEANPRLDYGLFERQFERFKQIVLARSGEDFVSFRTGQPEKEEGYKEEIYREGRRRLSVETWKKSQIGKGEILERVIQAIEIEGNNLVDWDMRRGPQGRSHRELCNSFDRQMNWLAWDTTFFEFFTKKRSPEDCFQAFLTMIGRRYDVIAYLYFLLDSTRFAPIATTKFDEAFALIGIDLKTTQLCSLQNYSAYIRALTEVREALKSVGVEEPRLIDAHSFCWMIATEECPASEVEPVISFDLLHVVPPTGDQIQANPSRGSVDRGPTDWVALQEMRSTVGRIAEGHALRREKQRLIDEGRADLAAQVKNVSENNSLGYDIKSFNADGTDRHIEVKSAQRKNGVVSFYVTENECRASRELANYFYYLVFETRTNPTIHFVPADEMRPEYLSPVVHEARLNAKFTP